MKLRTTIASTVLSIGILSSCASYAYAPTTVRRVESSTPCTYKYSFDCYRYTHKIPVEKCTLPSVEDDGPQAENSPLLCKETHKPPSKSESNVWDGYGIWYSCERLHSDYACQEMKN